VRLSVWLRVRLRPSRDQVEAVALAAIRRNGGRVGGGCLRGGKLAIRAVVAFVTWVTARSNAASVSADVFWTPLTLRTY
jgi:hypothetical protein